MADIYYRQSSKSRTLCRTLIFRKNNMILTEANHGHKSFTDFDIKNFYAVESDNPLTKAFPQSIAVHPGGKTRPVPFDQMDGVYTELLNQERKGKTAVYIHVPFCESHCLYCGFYRKAYLKDESRQYTDALIKELEMSASSKWQSSGPVHTVYVGGGTPTSLEAPDLERLLKAVKDNLPLANDCEITIEGRIKNFTKEKMDACINGGANRFSLGVQTFDTKLRQSMKRISSGEEVIESLKALRDYDQSAVIIDLIYGFPGQTMEMWENDIKTFLDLKLEGVDLYQLKVFEGTPLYTAIENQKLPHAADLEERASMFARGIEIMENAMYNRISVDHWARTNREKNTYNHMMKSPSNCLAFGPGAGGNIAGHFYFTESNYEKWVDNIENKKRKPLAMLQTPSPNAVIDKTITSEFELLRINPDMLEKEFSLPIKETITPLYEQWTKAGLMEKKGDWFVLTTAGQFWQVNIAQLTINYLTNTILKKK